MANRSVAQNELAGALVVSHLEVILALVVDHFSRLLLLFLLLLLCETVRSAMVTFETFCLSLSLI